MEPVKKFLFVSVRGGDKEIYAMNEDGTGVTQLTDGPDESYDPSWSPDYSKIVFVSTRSGSAELYTMNSYGNNEVLLVALAGTESAPAWSPDGTKIAFASNYTNGTTMNTDGNTEIWAIDANGIAASLVQLTNTFVAAGEDCGEPAWKPDGTKIAYSFFSAFNWEVYIMKANGTESVTETDSPSTLDWNPSWSPDGTKIAFATDRVDIRDVYVQTVGDPFTVVRMTTSVGVITEDSPVWSPDGTKIAFTSDRSGDFEIWTINSSGPESLSNVAVNLTNNVDADAYPEW